MFLVMHELKYCSATSEMIHLNGVHQARHFLVFTLDGVIVHTIVAGNSNILCVGVILHC